MQIVRGKIQSPQKVVIYGPEGIGKSTFASRFPNPVFIDTEGSTRHMDVARTPKPNSWTMLMEQIQYFKTHPNELGTLVIDTADWAESLCVEHICSKAQKNGIEDFGYGKGYTYLEENFGKMLNLLEDVIEAGVNTVVTAHAWMRKFEQPDEMGAYDRWELKLEKKTAPLLKEWADTVLFANYKTYVVNVDGQGVQKGKNKGQGGKRVMYTTHHPCWDAKNRWDLSPELPFEYEAIAMHIPSGNKTDSIRSDIEKNTQEGSAVSDVAKGAETNKPDIDRAKYEQVNISDIPNQTKSETANMNPPVYESEDMSKIPKALGELMATYQVSVKDVQKVVGLRGYYPEDTPIENYDPAFISGVLVGAWQQVYGMIKKNKQRSGDFVMVDSADGVPFN